MFEKYRYSFFMPPVPAADQSSVAYDVWGRPATSGVRGGARCPSGPKRREGHCGAFLGQLRDDVETAILAELGRVGE